MSEYQVLFCPFCRESFEGKKTCPEHDLALVGFADLSPDPLDPENFPEVIDETPLGLFEPTFGRGYVAAGALLIASAYLVTFLRHPTGLTGIVTQSLLKSVPSLGTPALVSLTVLFVLYRRRTPRALRSVRLLVPLLACVPPISCVWALQRIEQGMFLWPSGEQVLRVVPGLAVYVMGFASLLIFVGGLRLGVLPRAIRNRRSVGSLE